jgi:signal transduction histidine kinase
MYKFATTNVSDRIKEEHIKKENEFQQSVKNIYDEHIFSITHELRSPLAVISASTNNQYNILKGVYNSLTPELQAEHKLQFKDVKTQIEFIKHQSEIIEKFIASISEHASYIASEHDKKIINLHKFLQSVIMNSRSYSRNMKIFQNRIQFGDMVGSDFMNMYVDSSPHDLSRILINILSNAADAVMSAYKQKKEENKNWQPNLKIRCLRSDTIFKNVILTPDFLRINCTDDTKKCGQPFYIIIEDNGPGISETNLKKIFDYGFTTKKDSKSNKHYGLGLYLSIILANKNDISLYVRSDSNGTIFALGIPRTRLNNNVKPESDEESDHFTKLSISEDSKQLYNKYKWDETSTGLQQSITPSKIYF